MILKCQVSLHYFQVIINEASKVYMSEGVGDLWFKVMMVLHLF